MRQMQNIIENEGKLPFQGGIRLTAHESLEDFQLFNVTGESILTILHGRTNTMDLEGL